MFSGIVEQAGKIVNKKKNGKHITFTIQGKVWEKPLKKGESISVNGVCLTVTRILPKNEFVVQVVPETLAQTTLGELEAKDLVNLERSLAWGDRISGHFVLGHVDGMGKIIQKKKQGKSYSVKISVPDDMISYLVPKGSIAIDGISLTIQTMDEKARAITIAIIPHTAGVTTLAKKGIGDSVNLESDVISKHLSQMIKSKGIA